MSYTTVRECQRAFDDYCAKAMEAKKKEDYYNLVGYLRHAAECQEQMAALAADMVDKYQYQERAKKYRANAEEWMRAHPEAFANVDRGEKQAGAVKIAVQSKTGTTFEDIVGCEDVKKFVKTQYINRFSEKYKLVFGEGRGGSLERGMLLFGLPGTGKTMLARAIATEVDADFIAVKASDLKDSFVGNTEKNIQKLYDDAAMSGKLTIIFIDEIETLIPNRATAGLQNYDMSAVTQFLSVLDGFEKEHVANIITVAASNYPDRIDPAAIRPGRLGAWFRVDLPDAKLRRQLIAKHFSKGYTMAPEAISYLTAKTVGYSSADVVALCNRMKARLAEKGMAAVDQDCSEKEVLKISSYVEADDAAAILKQSNSSISKHSIAALDAFERNYNYQSANGGILDFMKTLS